MPWRRIRLPTPYSWASLAAQLVKNPPPMWETWDQSLGWEDPLEKRKAALFSILAWRIPWGCKESDMTEWLSLSLSIRVIISAFDNGNINFQLITGSKLAWKSEAAICPQWHCFQIKQTPKEAQMWSFKKLIQLIKCPASTLLSWLHLCLGHYTILPPERRSRKRKLKL